MEVVLASNDKNPLIGELPLGLKKSSPHVISRNKATVYCHTPVVEQNGPNVLTLNVSSATSWLDPLKYAIAFNVHNKGNGDLQVVTSNPARLFRRVEARLGGNLIDDITGQLD